MLFPFFDFLIQLAFLTLVRHCGAKAQDTDGNFMSNGYSQGEICYTKTGLKRKSMEIHKYTLLLVDREPNYFKNLDLGIHLKVEVAKHFPCLGLDAHKYSPKTG